MTWRERTVTDDTFTFAVRSASRSCSLVVVVEMRRRVVRVDTQDEVYAALQIEAEA